MKSNPPVYFVTLALTVVLLWGGVAGLRFLITARSHGDLISIGQPIVDKLIQFERQHARYPDSLEEAGIGNVVTDYGPFKYECYDEGKRCCLRIGEYAEDLFEVSWQSGRGWAVDS